MLCLELSAALAPISALGIGCSAPGVPFIPPHSSQTQLPSRGDTQWPWHPQPSLPRGGQRQRLGLLRPHHQRRGVALDFTGQGGLLPKHSQDGYGVRHLRSVHTDPGLRWVEREHGWCRNTSGAPQPSSLLFPSHKPIWRLASGPRSLGESPGHALPASHPLELFYWELVPGPVPGTHC